MTVVPELEAANRQYASTFDKGSLALAPARKLFVLTCMDARLDPARFLGLQEGDAHVHRNAGGRAIEALRSIVISQQLLGTREIVVVHHTDCGMLTFRDDDLRDKIGDELGQDASHIAFLPFRDLHESVRRDVEFLKKSPLVLDVPVTGYIYDVKTGRLEKLKIV